MASYREPGWTYIPANSTEEWTYDDIVELFKGNKDMADMLCELIDGQDPREVRDAWEESAIGPNGYRGQYVFSDSYYNDLDVLEMLMPVSPYAPPAYQSVSATGYRILESYKHANGSLDIIGHRTNDYGGAGYVIGYGYNPETGSWSHGSYSSSLAEISTRWAEVIGGGDAEDIGVSREVLAEIEYDLVGFVAELPAESRAAIARQGLFLDELSEDPDPDVRRAVAKSTEHGWQLSGLSNDPDPGVRMAVAERGFDLNRFSDDPDPAIRALAAAGNISAANLVKLAGDIDPAVQAAARENPLYDPALAAAAPVEQAVVMLERFKESFPAVLVDIEEDVTAVVSFPGERGADLFAVDVFSPQSASSPRRDMPLLHVTGHIPTDPNGTPIMDFDDVAAAVNLGMIASDPDKELGMPRIDPDNLQPPMRAAALAVLPLETRLDLAQRGKHLGLLSADDDPQVRCAVAEKGYLLSTLAADIDPAVRAAVAEQGHMLNHLLRDPDPGVRAAAKAKAAEYSALAAADLAGCPAVYAEAEGLWLLDPEATELPAEATPGQRIVHEAANREVPRGLYNIETGTTYVLDITATEKHGEVLMGVQVAETPLEQLADGEGFEDPELYALENYPAPGASAGMGWLPEDVPVCMGTQGWEMYSAVLADIAAEIDENPKAWCTADPQSVKERASARRVESERSERHTRTSGRIQQAPASLSQDTPASDYRAASRSEAARTPSASREADRRRKQ